MLDCIYCNEPISNEPATSRGGLPIHMSCNQELNGELLDWERETGVADPPNEEAAIRYWQRCYAQDYIDDPPSNDPPENPFKSQSCHVRSPLDDYEDSKKRNQC